MSPVIQPPDPDLEGLVKKSTYLPKSWWERLQRMSRETRCGMTYLVIQLMRWSLAEPEPAPLPEGQELLKTVQRNVAMTEERWAQLDAEAKRRGHSRNRVLQAHLLRAMDDYDRVQGKVRK